ncbi:MULTISPECIES: hypothetical protein [unclassified Streptomyces]|uniref:Uncharacterized protein n=1 Tax=Streptomyces sp. NBC_00119 TaxID=2975659 RepID=A0AAU1UJN0_9ACTN|nr:MULTISPECIES: hypothetical protein [unclassified Streptomyces]MCX4647971.1 hypothetical protein [Streptomyces sp. NBC_01446]MCX5320551.1 hypothetical protein [Streptomyces sp. NBC_00120]
MRYGSPLISDTLPRLDRITPHPQDETLAATHHSRDNGRLGERDNWTRAASTGSP